MAFNLIEMLTSQMGGSVLSQASSFLGESESSTKTAMGAALPAILGSVIQKGSDQSGAQGIMDMISSNGIDGNMLNNMGSMFGGGDSSNNMMNMGGGMLKSLMGNKMGGVVDMISKVSGIGSGSSSSLMSMLAPMVMGGIAKQVMGKGASGLMSFLGSQSGFVKAAAPAGLSNLMGFADMGNVGDMANKAMGAAGSMATSATGAVTETAEAGGSMLKKLMPLGLIALLALGAFYFFKGGSVVDAANSVTDKVSDAAGTVAGAAGDVANAAGNAAGNAVDAAGNAVDATGKAIGNAAGNAVDAAGNAVDATGKAIGDAASATVAAASKALEGVTFAAGSVGEKFTTFLASGSEGNGKGFAFNNLNFAVGSANIAASSLSEVDNLAKALVAYPSVHIEIGGHTDNTGSATNNLALSGKRAAAVKARLMEKGVDASRITTKGYGDTAPVADNTTDAGRKANRRTEAMITKR